MKPNLANSTFKQDKAYKNYKNVKKKLREYQKFVKENFDYVGENFAYEARSIHYGHSKKKKNIFGKASKNEIKELKEEGIEAELIPWVDDKSN